MSTMAVLGSGRRPGAQCPMVGVGKCPVPRCNTPGNRAGQQFARTCVLPTHTHTRCHLGQSQCGMLASCERVQSLITVLYLKISGGSRGVGDERTHPLNRHKQLFAREKPPVTSLLNTKLFNEKRFLLKMHKKRLQGSLQRPQTH